MTVERVDDGEVSPYLVDELRPGDEIELRGPIGGYFRLDNGNEGTPVSHRRRSGDRAVDGNACATATGIMPVRRRPLLYSSRTLGDVIYRGELDAMGRRNSALRVVHTLTRERRRRGQGNRRRIDRALLAEAGFPSEQAPRIYICGPSAFVETASTLLVGLGHDPLSIRTERFGPSGG
ncbi:MAG: hypothetical protein WDN69_21560 [Aliidongia sp.]